MKQLDELLNEMEQHISNHETVDTTISNGAVGWHIEHALLTLNMIIKGLKASDPGQYKSHFDIKRTFVMATGKIPRGKIKAPSVVQPTVQYNRESLLEHLRSTRDNIKSLDRLEPGKYFTHPFLGDFKLKPTKRFLQIHTNHHLCIMNDIVSTSPLTINKTAADGVSFP